MAADPLDAVLQEALAGPPATLTPDAPPAPKIARVHYTHAAMIDYILAHPGVHQNHLAAHFGYTPSWISTIMHSDAFQAAFALRSQEVVDPALRATVEEQFRGIALRAADIIREKLDKPAHQVPDQLALRAYELSTRAAGYGVKAPPAVPPQEMHIHLGEMKARLVGLLDAARATPVLEGDFSVKDESKG